VLLRRIGGQIQETVTPTSIFGKTIIYQQAAVSPRQRTIFLKQVIADFPWLRGLLSYR